MFMGALKALGSYALPKLGQLGMDLLKTGAKRLLGQSQSPYVQTLGTAATSLIDTFGNDIGIAQPSTQRRVRNRYRSMSAEPSQQMQRRMQRKKQQMEWQDTEEEAPQQKPRQQMMMRKNDYEEQF